MRRLLHITWIFAVAIFVGCRGQPALDVRIDNVAVIDVQADSVHQPRSIAISDGVIVDVSPARTKQMDANVVIDGTGLFALAGLWDMHVHTLWDVDVSKNFLPLFVANGVVGVRDMGGTIDVRHSVDSLITSGAIISPTIVSPGPLLDGPFPIDPSISEAITDSSQAVSTVDSLAEAGVDFIKVYTLLPREAFFGLVEQARKYGLPVAGHLPIDITVEEAIDAGMISIEHLNEGVEFLCNVGDCTSLATDLVEYGVYMTPTLSIIKSKAMITDSVFTSDNRLSHLPESVVSYWQGIAESRRTNIDVGEVTRKEKRLQTAMQLTAELNELDVLVLAGSDAGDIYSMPGFTLHDELKLMVDAGLTPAEALATATINPAKYLDEESVRGSIDAGKIADIILLRANPLSDIAALDAIEAVVQGGQVYHRDAIDDMLAKKPSLGSTSN